MPIVGRLPAILPSELPGLLARWREARHALLGSMRPFPDRPLTRAADADDVHASRLSTVMREAASIGITVRDPDAGWVDVDWPDGEGPDAVACWREGEARIERWHRRDEPCTRRRPA